MKVISIWQPWASLIVQGHKNIETRGWIAPRSIIGKTIGIASTKNISKEQKRLIYEPEFSQHFADTTQPSLDDLPLGHLLGTVVVEACYPITDKMIEGLSNRERAFGWYSVRRFAWHLSCQQAFDMPIPVIGKQGLWDWYQQDS